MRPSRVFIPLVLAMALVSGCARNTFLVHLEDGSQFYAAPPVVLSQDKSYYTFDVNGEKKVVDFDKVYYIDRAAQICWENDSTQAFTCLEAFYYY